VFHVAAWVQTMDPGGALTLVNVVHEDFIFTDGKDLLVPRQLPYLAGAAAMINDASGERAVLLAPSLAGVGGFNIEPVYLTTLFGTLPKLNFNPSDPYPLVVGEQLQVGVVSTPGVNRVHFAAVWLCDGPQFPVKEPTIAVRATATIQQAGQLWVSGPLVFDSPLPAGDYLVLGMRARSTLGQLARLVFPYQLARPGVPLVNTVFDDDEDRFRYGNAGAFGMFSHDNPPLLEVFSGSASAQTVILDLARF
jgi:hypothetical protein